MANIDETILVHSKHDQRRLYRNCRVPDTHVTVRVREPLFTKTPLQKKLGIQIFTE